jgi:hypothetical protein
VNLAWSDATIVTAIVAAFFLLMALIALARTILRRDRRPADWRIRVGVFLERDEAPTKPSPSSSPEDAPAEDQTTSPR